MFELYLFVNPIGHICYQSEQEILKVIDKVATHIDLHILPFHNQKLVENLMQQLGIESYNLHKRNQIFQTIYRASLAYKAASLQGKKNARYYLMRMQELIRGDVYQFNEDFALDLAREVGLDIEIFLHDMQSDFVKQLFFKDQKSAVDMQVNKAPALVIFDNLSSVGRLLINQPITVETILEELDYMTGHRIKECKDKEHTSKFKLL